MSSRRTIFPITTPAVNECQLANAIKMARAIKFPLEVFPEPITEWLMALAFSVNTRPEFILIAAISVVSTLMGPKTKLKIRNRYREPCNLFTVCLSEPGAGKSQAFEIAVESPIRALKEPAHSMVIHDFTRKGLFQHLVSHDGRALLAHSEMSSFYEFILKKQQEGSGERQLFCRLYDGIAEWALTSACTNNSSSAGKVEKRERREVLLESTLALGGFTQPEPFLQLFKPLAKTKDGFLDRILICSIKPRLLLEEEVEQWCEKLEEYTTQEFSGVYKTIFDKHENGVEYCYSPEAKEKYTEYANNLSKNMNAQWDEESICTENFSKDKKNFIRISCVLHVLLSVLSHFIDNEKDGEECDIEKEIPRNILSIAEAVMEYFGDQRKAFMTLIKPVSKENSRSSSTIPDDTGSSSSSEIINAFGQWFVGRCKDYSEECISKFAREKKKVGDKEPSSIAIRIESIPDDGGQPIIVDKSELKKAVVKEGGQDRDTSYFLNQDGKKQKAGCLSIPLASFTVPLKHQVLQVLKGLKLDTLPQEIGSGDKKAEECLSDEDENEGTATDMSEHDTVGRQTQMSIGSIEDENKETETTIDMSEHDTVCRQTQMSTGSNEDENEETETTIDMSENDRGKSDRSKREMKKLTDALSKNDRPSKRKRRKNAK
ncbi:uncharacterized protein LOC114544164 [Dendronephthya gigantea]|uniref:uncharacterized protein LOC114544164 n=1 Tax=Dendronephthya gigantea TaxID=151771 RepID=UPI00106B3A53|nr:uncharacterized protein LOC114544164 [Dendronephthya gigantea]